jgi:hypothetical protein
VSRKPPEVESDDRSIWTVRAERVARQVLDEVVDGTDALPTVSLLEAVLRAEVGDLPADEVAGLDASFRRDEDPGAGCICPPELLARDGFRGACPVHATAG